MSEHIDANSTQLPPIDESTESPLNSINGDEENESGVTYWVDEEGRYYYQISNNDNEYHIPLSLQSQEKGSNGGESEIVTTTVMPSDNDNCQLVLIREDTGLPLNVHIDIDQDEMNSDSSQRKLNKSSQCESKENKLKRKSHICDTCGYVTHKRHLLGRHMKSHHCLVANRNIECPICGKPFKKASALKRHQMVHHANTNHKHLAHVKKDNDSKKKWKPIRNSSTIEMNRHKTYKSRGSRNNKYVFFQQLQYLKNVVKIGGETDHKSTTTQTEDNINSLKDQKSVTTANNQSAHDGNIIEAIKESIKNRERNATLNRDEDRLFMLSLIDTLKRVPQRNKIATKMKIMSILDEACMEAQDNIDCHQLYSQIDWSDQLRNKTIPRYCYPGYCKIKKRPQPPTNSNSTITSINDESSQQSSYIPLYQ